MRRTAAAANGIDAVEDIHASSEYRLHLARVMTRRALEPAVARARGWRRALDFALPPRKRVGYRLCNPALQAL